MTDSASQRTESVNRYKLGRPSAPLCPFGGFHDYLCGICRRKVLFWLLVSGSKHHGPVEGQARFRAIPLDEFVDGVVVLAWADFGVGCFQNSQFCLFRVRE